MALVEFIYPHIWHNVNAKNNLIDFDVFIGKEVDRRIPAGFYATVQDILKAIFVKEHQNKIYDNFNHATKRVRIIVKPKCKIILYDGLAQLLGFKTKRIEALETDVSKESDYIADTRA